MAITGFPQFPSTDLEPKIYNALVAIHLAIWNLSEGGGVAGPIIDTDLTMNTNRLLGRTTSGEGAIEEISVGTGLALAGGVLSGSGATPVYVSAITVTPTGVLRIMASDGNKYKVPAQLSPDYEDILDPFPGAGANFRTDPTTGNILFGEGGNTNVYISTNGGLAWTALTSHALGDRYEVGNGLVLRLRDDLAGNVDIYVSSDNGATWGAANAVPAAMSATGVHVNWISGSDWLVWGEGTTDVATCPDDGVTWTLQAAALTWEPDGGFGVNRTSGAIILSSSQYAPGAGGVSHYNRSTDGGATWTAYVYPIVDWFIPCASETGEWIGQSLESDDLTSSTDDGITFTAQTLPVTTTTNLVGPRIGEYNGAWYFFVGSNGVAAPADVGIWKSEDAGATWTHIAYDSVTRDDAYYQIVLPSGTILVQYVTAAVKNLMLYNID